jgi:hypothetical protein
MSLFLITRSTSLRSLTLPLSVAIAFASSTLGAEAEPAYRAARSVHLGYPAPEGDLFYNELAVEQSVEGSYFMACGWNTGYFGIQQLGSPEKKVVIFSVWDPATGDDPQAVKTKDRVEVLFQGEGVRIRRFGGEGTGGQCLAPWAWRVGETNRFLLRAEVQEQKTAYTAWVFRQDQQAWWKLATFRARTGGQQLQGYYSFIEDFRRDGKSVHDLRRARFGNGWVRTSPEALGWKALDKARFTASNAEWESKDNIDAGSADGWFFLATGGEITTSRKLHSLIELSPAKTQPPVGLPENLSAPD